MKKIHFETIDSTNAYLKEHHRECVDFSLISADHQTAGRGRLGRVWTDEGKSALFSILVKTNISVSTVDKVPLVAACAVHKVLCRYLSGMLIKWPNDIVYKGQKIAGILVESVIEEKQVVALIIGIGININNRSFGPTIAYKSSSLFLEKGKEFPIGAIIDEIAEMFEAEYKKFEDGLTEYIRYCNNFSALEGRDVRFTKDGEAKEGVAGMMQPDGSLLIQTIYGPVQIRSGEVTLQSYYFNPSDR